jgi:hypothetical protein
MNPQRWRCCAWVGRLPTASAPNAVRRFCPSGTPLGRLPALRGTALAALERFHGLSRDYVNVMYPMRKRTEKGAVVPGSRAATTVPDALSSAAGKRCLAAQKTDRQLGLRSATVNPLRLKTRARIRSAHRGRACRPACHRSPASVGTVMKQPSRLWSDLLLRHHVPSATRADPVQAAARARE